MIEIDKEFLKFCEKLGKDSTFVQGAGGNISIKDGEYLYIKETFGKTIGNISGIGLMSCELVCSTTLNFAFTNYITSFTNLKYISLVSGSHSVSVGTDSEYVSVTSSYG